MGHLIEQVEADSLAAKHGICAGDILLSINGEDIQDEIDYQALIANPPLSITIQRGDSVFKMNIPDCRGRLGIRFGESMVLSPRTCRNRCVFCFISQLPPHLRQTLYVKDDDWRYSLMMGNYVTLTNVDDREFARILRRKPSPLYISVHSTDPQLRCRMMSNRFAGNIMARLTALKSAGIRFHCQIVACPGLNDGEQLIRTLTDLRSLYPAAQSTAVVPVGLTRFRDSLPFLQPYTKESAAALLDLLEPFQHDSLEKCGTSFAFASDEFYCLCGRKIPGDSWYEDYPQIENGVGLLRQLESELENARSLDASNSDDYLSVHRHYLIPTGVSAAPHISRLVEQYAPIGTEVRVLPVPNHFFGESVTVTGLLTGGDLLKALTPDILQNTDAVLISSSMLRSEGDLFLDNMHIDKLREALHIPVHVVDNDGFVFYQALHGHFQ